MKARKRHGKSNSNRRKIFLNRARGKIGDLIEAVGTSLGERLSGIDKRELSRELSQDVHRAIIDEKNSIFSGDPVIKKSDDERVKFILRKLDGAP